MIIREIASQLKKSILLLSLLPGLISFIIALNGCFNDDGLSFIEGKYRGIHTLTRNFGTDSSLTTQDTLTFVFGRSFVRAYFESLGNRVYDDMEYYYTGNGTTEGRLVLTGSGGGDYSSDGEQINLLDKMMRLALYDGSIILQGRFEYSYNGRNLTMIQNDTKSKRFHKITLSRVNL